MKRLCALLPAHNEAAHIADVVAAVRAVRLDDTEIIPLVVNDGSRDATSELAARAGAVVVDHPINRGVGAGFRTGVEWARREGVDFLVHLDSDGQIPPHQIPLLYEPVRRGDADLALGSRFLGAWPANLSRWKATSLHLFARGVGALTGHALSDISCGFRCMNRRVLEAVNPSFDYDYIQETLLQALAIGARVVDVPVEVLYQRGAPDGMSARTLRYSARFVGLVAYSLAHFYRARTFG